jgi:DNA recombination protein RmuC
MPFETFLPFLLTFVMGAVVGAAVSSLLRAGRGQRELLEATGQLSAARAAAHLEETRREDLEGQLEEARSSLAELGSQVAVAEDREVKAEQLITELKTFSERSKKELEDSFKALAAEALAGSSKQFLNLAQERLKTSQERGRAELEERKKAIETLLSPLQETLLKLDDKTLQIEKARVDAYSRIDQQVKLLAQATQSLQDQTTSLATALSSSQVRGRWGEIALRNVAELAGMTAHCDFEEQTAIGDGKRPDMTVNLPGGRKIAVDAKAPLTDYLKATETTDETVRQAALERHVKALRGHVKELAARNYAQTIGSDIDLVVLFLPGDPFLSAAFSKDPDLQVEALRSKVLIATPTTLVALLRTVAIYWQQRSMAENADAIAAVARELYDRAAKLGVELEGIRKGLKSALDAYNRAVGSFDRRLLPMGRRLSELKVSEQSKRELVAPEPIDEEPRRVSE